MLLLGILIILLSLVGAFISPKETYDLDTMTDDVLRLSREYLVDYDDYEKSIELGNLTKVGSDYMLSPSQISEYFGVTYLETDDGFELLRDEDIFTINSQSRLVKKNNDYDYLEDGKYIETESSRLLSIDKLSQWLDYELSYIGSKAVLTRPYLTKRLIVKASEVIDSVGAIEVVGGYKDIYFYQFDSEEDARIGHDLLKDNKLVEWVDINAVVSVDPMVDNIIESSDTKGTVGEYYTWGAESMGIDAYTTKLLENHVVSDLREVIVPVLDTGIDSEHPWFEGRIATGGLNYTTDFNNPDSAYQDAHGHGTHVSGTICDLTENNVKVLPMKVLNDTGKGGLDGIILAMHKVLEYKTVNEMNIYAINMSLGGGHSVGSSGWSSYDSIVKELKLAGVLTVAAAGNEGDDVATSSPANVGDAITVAAIGVYENGTYYRPSWSNFGSYLDVTAPGNDIVSAYPNNMLAMSSGTSMAAPHITGAIALMESNPDISYKAEEMEDIVTSTVLDLGASGWDSYYGYGLFNIKYSYAELMKSDVIFSMEEGDCSEAFDLTLSISEPDAVIYYTLDGTTPSLDNGLVYSTPITIDGTTIVMATAFVRDSGGNVTKYSKVVTKTYSFGIQDAMNNYVVTDGVLTSYMGNLADMAVPEYVNGERVVAIGENAFSNSSVVNVILPSSVVDILDSAFAGCTTIQSVTAPQVSYIGDGAFAGCISYKKLNDTYFPNLKSVGIDAFRNCYALEDVSLSKLEIIGDQAFAVESTSTATNMSIINMEKLISVGRMAFYNRTKLVSLHIDSVEIIADSAFKNCRVDLLNLPNLKYLGSYAFYDNTAMSSLNLPKVEVIGAYAFQSFLSESYLSGYSANKITELNLPEVKYIGKSAFKALHDLTDVDLPKVEILASGALSFNFNLTSVNIPNLAYMGRSALSSCSSLETLSLPSIIEIQGLSFSDSGIKSLSLSSIIEYIALDAFGGMSNELTLYVYLETIAEDYAIEREMNYSYVSVDYGYLTYQVVNGESVTITGINAYVSQPSNVVIPETIDGKPVTGIATNAFKNNTNIERVSSKTLKSIGAEAFYGATNLESLDAENLETIGVKAFYNCPKLYKVSIARVVTISDRAFYGCPSLREIRLNNTLTTIGQEALGYTLGGLIDSEFTIYGNTGSVANTYATDKGLRFLTKYSGLQSAYIGTYDSNGDGVEEVFIGRVDTTLTGNLMLPSTINGMQVTGIDAQAFYGCSFITGIYLPSTLVNINAQAFAYCTRLKEINLENVTTIGAYAFYECNSLEKIVANKITAISEYTFAYCSDLSEVSIPNVKTINRYAFAYCYSLQRVSMPSATSVLDYAFACDYRLNDIDTNSLLSLGDASGYGYSFAYCSSLTSLYLANIVSLRSNSFTNSGVTKLVIGDDIAYSGFIGSMSKNIDIYGYSDSGAEIFASTNGNRFYPINSPKIETNLQPQRTVIQGNDITLSVDVIGYDLKYQWYRGSGESATKILGENTSSYSPDCSVLGETNYYVKATNWDGSILTSRECNVKVVSNANYHTVVAYDGEHYLAKLTGYAEGGYPIVVADGDSIPSGVHIIFEAKAGYLIDSITTYCDGIQIRYNNPDYGVVVADLNNLSDLQITGDITFSISMYPRTDISYTVKHYKEVLTPSATSIEVNGAYYELEEMEALTGTTGVLTSTTPKVYTNYTVAPITEKNISGLGDTEIAVYYNRNRYTLTLNIDDGISAAIGSGEYRFGETVNISASLKNGYNWSMWTTSDDTVFASIDTKDTSIIMPTSNVTFTATTSIKTFRVNITLDSGVTIEPSETEFTMNYGESKSITIRPNENYKIFKIIVNEEEISIVAIYQIRNIDKDYSISIESVREVVVVEIRDNLSSDVSSQTAEGGTTFNYIVPTKSGYDISSVIVNDAEVEVVDGAIDIEVGDENIQIEVVYTEKITDLSGGSEDEEEENSPGLTLGNPIVLGVAIAVAVVVVLSIAAIFIKIASKRRL